MWGVGESESARKKSKAMWLYPKVVGFNPPERWGHSACYSHGHIYIFGGCCGGLHFSDVLALDLETMVWRTVATTSQGPGPRDSHTAVLVGHRMFVFGGTNGSRKVNDLHILDLRSREWTRPDCRGTMPSPRESHTATLVCNDKMVVFGGSGEGEGNYLNDLHVLDLLTMRWTSPEVKGDVPVPRDSHSAVTIENKLFVYGGDCGDRYLGDVNVLDLDTMTWSKLNVQGFLPGVRAGHGAVNIGTKIYVIGGVGDKHYYNDVWVLDTNSCMWTQLDTHGVLPRGRFSHTTVAIMTGIVIYGGCGEDERPLNELLILQLEGDHVSSHQNNSMCNFFLAQGNRKDWRWLRGSDSMIDMNNENKDATSRGVLAMGMELKESIHLGPDNLRVKRGRTACTRALEVESEQEEHSHSLSLSQHSSPSSQSDQEQTPFVKAPDSVRASREFHFLKQPNRNQSNVPHDDIVAGNPRRFKGDANGNRPDPILGRQEVLPRREQFLYISQRNRQCPPYQTDQTPNDSGQLQNMMGAEVRGKVDGAFDSGFLVTATVNGKLFRGVLFAPAQNVISRGAILAQNPPSRAATQVSLAHPLQNSAPIEATKHPQQPPVARPFPFIRGSPSSGREPRPRSDLQGVVLTLGGPGTGAQ